MTISLSCSELVEEVVEAWDAFLESLSGSDSFDKLASLGGLFVWVSVKGFPMIEHTLWESTSGGSGSEGLGETEGLSDRKEGLHVDEWGSVDWLFSGDNTSSLGEALVDTTDSVIWALNLNKEDWFLESWFSGELGSVEHTSTGRDDLTATSVDSIGVEGNIMDVESASSHVLFSHSTLSCGPLEGSLDGILNFLEILDGLGNINEQVWSGSVWSEAPNLLGIIRIPLVCVLEMFGSLFHVLFVGDLSFFDFVRKLIVKWLSIDVESVVLVWRL